MLRNNVVQTASRAKNKFDLEAVRNDQSTDRTRSRSTTIYRIKSSARRPDGVDPFMGKVKHRRVEPGSVRHSSEEYLRMSELEAEERKRAPKDEETGLAERQNFLHPRKEDEEKRALWLGMDNESLQEDPPELMGKKKRSGRPEYVK